MLCGSGVIGVPAYKRERNALNRCGSHTRAGEGSERSDAGAISTDARATCQCQPVVAVLRASPAESCSQLVQQSLALGHCRRAIKQGVILAVGCVLAAAWEPAAV
jgi:hypothetical protein